MPKVPTFTPQTQLTVKGPSTELDIRSFGMEELAQARSWEGVGQAGEKLAEISMRLGQSIKAAQDYSDYAEGSLRLKEGLFKLREEVKLDSDPDKWAPVFQEKAQKLFNEEYQGQKSAQVQAHLKARWANIYPAWHYDVSKEARRQKIAIFAGQLDEAESRYVDLAAQATNDLERAQIRGDYFGRLAGGVQAGLIMPDKAEIKRQIFDKQVNVALVNKDIRENPWLAADKLMEPGRHYPGLAEDAARVLRGAAEAEVHRRQGVNALEVDKVYDQKKLTPEMLAQMRDGRVINLSTYRFYSAALERDAAGLKAETDMDVYIPLWKAAQKGQMNPEEVYRHMQAGGLTKQDGQFLIRTQETGGVGLEETAFTKDPYFRLAVQEIETRLKPLERMMAISSLKPGPKEASPSHSAAFLFLEACKEAQKKGELTGPWMWQKVNEIIRPFEVMGMRGLVKGKGVPAGGMSAPPENEEVGVLAPGRARIKQPLFNPTAGPKGSQQEKW